MYRGIPIDITKSYASKLLQMPVGTIYSDLGFLSTSHSIEHASIGKPSIKLIMGITLEPGVHAFPLTYDKGTAAKKKDYEILIARETKFILEKKIVRIIRTAKTLCI